MNKSWNNRCNATPAQSQPMTQPRILVSSFDGVRSNLLNQLIEIPSKLQYDLAVLGFVQNILSPCRTTHWGVPLDPFGGPGHDKQSIWEGEYPILPELLTKLSQIAVKTSKWHGFGKISSICDLPPSYHALGCSIGHLGRSQVRWIVNPRGWESDLGKIPETTILDCSHGHGLSKISPVSDLPPSYHALRCSVLSIGRSWIRWKADSAGWEWHLGQFTILD